MKAAYDLALFSAWHVEAFARTKHLPELRKLLDHGKPAPHVALAAKIKTVMSQFRRASA